MKVFVVLGNTTESQVKATPFYAKEVSRNNNGVRDVEWNTNDVDIKNLIQKVKLVVGDCNIPGKSWANDGIVARLDFLREGPEGQYKYHLSEIGFWPMCYTYLLETWGPKKTILKFAEAMAKFVKDNMTEDKKAYPA